MTIEWAAPAIVLLVGALIAPIFPQRARSPLVVILPIVALIWLWTLPGGNLSILVDGNDPHQFDLFTLGRLFATVFALLAVVANLFACRQASGLELGGGLFYAGSAIGMVLSDNFASLLVFWELMAIGSTIVLFSAGTRAATRASLRYFAIHALSGVLLFAGVLGLYVATGDLTLRALETNTVYAWLILASFLINAGAPPFSGWISDAYPEASPSGAVYLSAFTTKASVFALLAVFAGEPLLIFFGVYMIFYGIIYALLENDIRRILTYSIVNQVGFMVTGIGIGTALALNGAALHAFAHIIYKALLLMSAGSVLYMTGKRKCLELGGLYRSMRLTTVCAIIGALAISAFPLTSGFVSKPMITQAALNQHWLWLWLALLAASAGVFLHAGIKFPWFVFFQKDSGLRPADPPPNMCAAMGLFAFACIFLGVFPEFLYMISPWQTAYIPYTTAHVTEKLELLLFGGSAFFVMLPLLRRTPTISLDFDWLYRRGLPKLESGLARILGKLYQIAEAMVCRMLNAGRQRLDDYYRSHHLLAKYAQSSSLIGWLVAVLIIFLFVYLP